MITYDFPTLNLKETGNRIHTLRVNSGYTVEEIACYMGFTGPQAVYKWEWGKSLPTVDNLYALSKLFGVSIEKILVGNDEFFYVIGNSYHIKSAPLRMRTSRSGILLLRNTARARRISQARFFLVLVLNYRFI
ncbi:MAG: helix-turn-helix transcriptional regulator [Lachnospiraceae bacterium]|nr:helix-turn-helix transcriptional regulator [Lachnospiraceae bacterium]